MKKNVRRYNRKWNTSNKIKKIDWKTIRAASRKIK